MVSLRKGNAYRHITRVYTRKSKVRGKDYIKAVPNSKIVNYNMGDLNGKFEYELQLISKTAHQIRHNAIESSRLVVNRRLNLTLGTKNYYFQILVYPHHILRENKMLSGAGADRMQTGMAHSFGKAVGLAAQVKRGKKIFLVRVSESNLDSAKKALKLARPRMPSRYGIEIKKIAQ